MEILLIDGLSKSFGKQKIITNLNLSVPEGTIFGFVGQNGAGKTTTMKMVLGLLRADRGKIQVCGETVTYGRTSSNRHIGYLPDVPEFYNDMRSLEYLMLCGKISGLAKQEIRTRSDELLALVGLGQETKRIGSFSRGMKQRLGIAQALLSRPQLLICDEPTSALDPLGRKDILDILSDIKEKTTVIFSSHILSDVERICNHVAILDKGSIAVCGKLSDIKTMYGKNSLHLTFANFAEIQLFQSCNRVKSLLNNAEKTETELFLHGADLNKIQRDVIAALAETRLCPLKMERMEPSLENLYLEVIK